MVVNPKGVQSSLEGGHSHKLGLLEDDGRYDSPCDTLYGFSSPLPAHQAVSRGWAAAMGQPLYLGQPHPGQGPGQGMQSGQGQYVAPPVMNAADQAWGQGAGQSSTQHE